MTTHDTRTRRQPAPPSPPSGRSGGGLDLPTLAIAAIAAVVAATVVSHFWGAGTIFATALTPVIVAVVKEGLARPAKRITEVSAKAPSAAAKIMGARYDAEGPVVVAEEYDPHQDEVGEYRVYGRPKGRAGGRRAWKLAIVTGLLAFVVAALAMTLPELVAGRSLFNSGKETTLFRGTRHKSSTSTKTTSTPSATQTTVTTVTQTTTTPSQTTPTTTPTTPAQTQSTPAQTTTTPPPAATTTPAQTTPAPVP